MFVFSAFPALSAVKCLWARLKMANGLVGALYQTRHIKHDMPPRLNDP